MRTIKPHFLYNETKAEMHKPFHLTKDGKPMYLQGHKQYERNRYKDWRNRNYSLDRLWKQERAYKKQYAKIGEKLI